MLHHMQALFIFLCLSTITIAAQSTDPYHVLGVSRDATLRQVRRAYHRLVRQLHPDKSDADVPEFVRLTEAYEEITDEDGHFAFAQEMARDGNGPSDSLFADFKLAAERSRTAKVSVTITIQSSARVSFSSRQGDGPWEEHEVYEAEHNIRKEESEITAASVEAAISIFTCISNTVLGVLKTMSETLSTSDSIHLHAGNMDTRGRDDAPPATTLNNRHSAGGAQSACRRPSPCVQQGVRAVCWVACV